MRSKFLFLTILLLFSIPVLLSFSKESKKSPKDLPERYRSWLLEDVIYIITPVEKEVFLQLENDRERNLFMEAFWKQRDPDPITPENEFREEHYRRINYANKWYGRGTPTPGWKTDMGRIYIILGEPKSIEKYENLTEVYPSIVWFYQGMGKYGLPDSFNVVFFKMYGSGDYITYSPIRDGPQKLLVHYFGDPRDYLRAFEELKMIQPQLAQVSLSLITGESAHGPSPSLASDILLSNIDVKPQKMVKDQYAEKLLKYKDIIEVEYSANYIGNDHLVSIIQDQSGVCFVHYLIAPDKLSVTSYEDTFRTNLEISGHITDPNGKTIYQFNKTIPIQFGKDQLQKIKTLPFSFQDAFPLLEGQYKLNLLLKNKSSKEFTSVETELLIPSFRSPREMTSLILAPSAKNSPSIRSIKPFRIEDIQVYPVAKNEYTKNDKLFVFFQVPAIGEELRKSGRIEFVFYKGDEEFLREPRDISSYPRKGQFLEEFSLADFPPSYYRLEVNILSSENEIVLSNQARFFVSYAEALPRPFIYADQAPSTDDALTDYVLGGQYFNKGNLEKAEYFLKKAYSKKPLNLTYAEGYSRILFIKEDFEQVKKILLPFLDNPEKNLHFLNLLGQACQRLSQFEEAIDYFKQYLSHYGTNLEVLNTIGFCYASLGDKEKALEAWEKSLEINPNQDQIKKLVTTLKDKK